MTTAQTGQEGAGEKALGLIARGLALLAVACIAFVLIATTADVARRALFERSIRGVIELSEVLMVAIVFLGLAYAERRNAHVAMTLVVRRLPARTAAVVHTLGVALGVVVIGWMLLATFDRAMESFRVGEHRFGIVRIPIWPARFAIVVGLAAYLLELGLRLRRTVNAIRGRSTLPSDVGSTEARG